MLIFGSGPVKEELFGSLRFLNNTHVIVFELLRYARSEQGRRGRYNKA